MAAGFVSASRITPAAPGGDVTRQITIIAPDSPATAPIITNISADGATPPNITLDVLGRPNTTYNVKASADLNDGFPVLVTTVTTDGTGFGAVTFTGMGARQFYRLEY